MLTGKNFVRISLAMAKLGHFCYSFTHVFELLSLEVVKTLCLLSANVLVLFVTPHLQMPTLKAVT